MKNWLRSNKGLLAFLLLFGVFRTAVADWNPIPSGSMRPTLLEGDVVFVNRLAFDLKLPLTQLVLARLGEPQRGDVVTFYSPVDGTHLIKRLVALPGDVVAMRDDQLTINGRPALYRPLGVGSTSLLGGATVTAQQQLETIDGRSHRIELLPQVAARRDFAPVTVGPDQFMMLGDNRDNSADSRYIGLVPRSLLIGRAERILVSADMLGNWHPRIARFGASLAQ
ncbi:signal peptidase I [Massilia sp. PWRC2]|uniref:signal peptidase I n=1 Tax=Massilia sp. PWRC2 TaxID=2804626 RepID=UPI003CEAFF14